ncbi:MAG TPA: hypothetical protein VI585_25500 [Candidatus Binatia bacterium]
MALPHICFSLEQPRPHALGGDCLSGPSVVAVLEKHPWYAHQWQARLKDGPVADRALVLFMQAARWADDIRMRDKQHHRGPWHYINWPFKPEGQLATVQTTESEPA